MFKTTIKGLLAHKIRLVTTMLSIVLGVSLMAGTLVLTDTVGRTFDDLYADVGRGTDAVVRSSTKVSSNSEDRGPIAASAVDAVRSIPQVQAAAGQVQGYAQFVGKDGKVIGDPSQGAPTLGMNWPESGMPNPFTLSEGREPHTVDELVMDKATADKGGFAIGDRVGVLTQGSPRDLAVVGIARFGSVDSPAGASIALFDTATAQAMVGQPGQFNSISVVATPGTSQDDLVAALRPALPTGTEALTGAAATAEQQQALRENISFFATFLLVFALIALFVGSFIIYNTFSITIAQRTRELATLRALGAGRAQVRRAVLFEAVIVGVLASLLGVVAGVFMAAGLKALLDVMGFETPASGAVVSTGTVLVSLVTGIAITVTAAWLPARKASKIAPIAALSSAALDTSARSRGRVVAGFAVTGLGAGALALGLLGGMENAVAMVGLGAAITFFGVAILGPTIARPFSWAIGTPIAGVRGMSGRLARNNAMRNPRRTSSTAAALMIGVALVGFITIFAASAKTSIGQTFDKSLHGDYVIDSGMGGMGTLSTNLADQLRTQPEIAQVTSVRQLMGDVAGEGTSLVAVDPATAQSAAELDVRSGALAALDQDAIAVSSSAATDHGWKVGDVVATTFLTGDRPLTIEAVYGNKDLVGDFVIGFPLYDEVAPQAFDSMVYITLQPGTTSEAGRAAIDRVADAYPNAKVSDLGEFKASMSKPIDQMLNLIYALLFLAVVIALIGITNTLALSIHERTRELGLLRSVGMTRGQLRSSVRWESVIIALFGTVLGLGIAVFFGWAIVHALAAQGFTTLTVPVAQLATVTVLAAFAGVGAAILPARRAARLDVLDAIASA